MPPTPKTATEPKAPLTAAQKAANLARGREKAAANRANLVSVKETHPDAIKPYTDAITSLKKDLAAAKKALAAKVDEIVARKGGSTPAPTESERDDEPPAANAGAGEPPATPTKARAPRKTPGAPKKA